jgi:hypothetical protein
MAGILDGIDLSSPDPDSKKKKPAATTDSDAGGILSGVDLNAPDKTAKQPTYDNTSTAGLVGDTAYRAANTGSLGLLDYGLAGLHKAERATGYDPNATDLDTIQRQGNEWAGNHPVLALGADIAGYGFGAGKIGAGAKAAKFIGKGVLARMAGAGAESAAATGISDELKSQGQISTGDLLKDLAVSGTVGTATGAIPVKGALKGEASQTPALATATKQAFAPLKNAEFHPANIRPTYDGAVSKITSGQRVNLDSEFKGKMTEISSELADKFKNNQTVTADDIASYSRALRDNAPTKLEQDVAADLDTALHKAVTNSTPTGSSGMRTGGQVSQAIKDANAAAERSKASQNIDDWIKQGGKNAGKTSEAIDETLTKNPGFFKQPGVRPALEEAAKPPSVGSQLAAVAGRDIATGAITGGSDYLFGSHNPYISLLAGGAAAAGAHQVGKSFGNPGGAALARKLAAARHLNATGMKVDPSEFSGGVPNLKGPMGIYAPNFRGAPGVGVSNFFDESQYQ